MTFTVFWFLFLVGWFGFCFVLLLAFLFLKEQSPIPLGTGAGVELSLLEKMKTVVDGLWKAMLLLLQSCMFLVLPRFLCVFIHWICENVVFRIFLCCPDLYQQTYSTALLLQAGLSTAAQCCLLILSHVQGAILAAWMRGGGNCLQNALVQMHSYQQNNATGNAACSSWGTVGFLD